MTNPPSRPIGPNDRPCHIRGIPLNQTGGQFCSAAHGTDLATPSEKKPEAPQLSAENEAGQAKPVVICPICKQDFEACPHTFHDLPAFPDVPQWATLAALEIHPYGSERAWMQTAKTIARHCPTAKPSEALTAFGFLCKSLEGLKSHPHDPEFQHDTQLCIDRLRAALTQQPAVGTSGADSELFKRHTKAVGEFLNELYAIMVDPLADGTLEVSQIREELLAAAKRDRELRNGLAAAEGAGREDNLRLLKKIEDVRDGKLPSVVLWRELVAQSHPDSQEVGRSTPMFDDWSLADLIVSKIIPARGNDVVSRRNHERNVSGAADVLRQFRFTAALQSPTSPPKGTSGTEGTCGFCGDYPEDCTLRECPHKNPKQ